MGFVQIINTGLMVYRCIGLWILVLLAYMLSRTNMLQDTTGYREMMR